jgi:hypothetical protein
MKRIIRLLVGCTAVLTLASPAAARVAAIETTVPLADDSEPAMHAAVEEALSTLALGAQAMGLPHLHLLGAAIVDHAVVIRVLATDTPAADEPSAPASPDESVPPSKDDGSSRTGAWL